MFKLLNWYKDYRLAIIAAKSARENAQVIALQKIVEAQMEVVGKWFTGFTTTEIPTSSVVREEDEWFDEQQRSDPRVSPKVIESFRNGIAAGAFPEIESLLEK